MSEKETKKVVRDLKPTTDAKGGRHGHHHSSHRHLTAGGKGGHDHVERAGKYWL